MAEDCLFCERARGVKFRLRWRREGRRTAFDPATRGLWMVCAPCGAWNLSPLEGADLTAALAECQARFDASPKRDAIDGVGVAHISRGETLVRVGAVTPGRLLGWRYWEQLRLRRPEFIVRWVTELAAAWLLSLAMAAVRIPTLPLAIGLWMLGSLYHRHFFGGCYVSLPNGDTLRLTDRDLGHLVVCLGTAGDLRLRIVQDEGDTIVAALDAADALRTAFPRLNGLGASKKRMREAIALVGSLGTDGSAVARTQGSQADRVIASLLARHKPACVVRSMPVAERMALEIAVNERMEWRAIERDLALLALEGQDAAALAQGVAALDATLTRSVEPNQRNPT